ncbi:MAG: mycofactocin precursor MftA [Acidimicrobiia bacterium]
MESPTAPTTVAETDSVAETETETAAVSAVIESELLVEEISIDGMCGVY